MKNFYSQFSVILLALLLVAADANSQKKILFVGRDALGDYQSDQDMVDSMIAWGYDPVFWDSNGEYDVGTGPDFNPLDYANYEGVFFNETVDSKAVARFASDGYPLPCINLEGYAVATGNDRWAWISDNGAELFQTPDAGGTADDQVFVVADNSHYITEIFDVGEEIVWSTADIATDIAANRPVSIMEVNVTYDGKLGTMKSHAAQDNFWNLATIDDMDGTENRMVFWGLNHIGLNGEAQDGSYGTPDFFTMIKRASAWAYDGAESSTSVEAVKSDPLSLSTYPNPAEEKVTIRFHSASQSDFTATLFSITGQQMEVITRAAVSGINHLSLDVNKFPAGIYHLKLQIEGNVAVSKIMIR
ncbi:MAG: T9SS type A sorting domain-containing protein [Bacteroidales bacterium]